MEETKTAQFIPNVSLSDPELFNMYDNGYLNIYLGIKLPNGKKEYGKHLYALVEGDYDFSDYTNYVSDIILDNHRLIKLSIPDRYKETVVKPFKKGQYSKVSKKFVRKYIPRKENDQTVSTVWKVYNKAPSLKEYWEWKIGVELPKDAEVWSKPLKSEEIFQL